MFLAEHGEALTPCKHMVSDTISRPLAGVLFTFPSRYLFTIGYKEYLVLGESPPVFPRPFTNDVVLENDYAKHKTLFVYRTITSYGLPFQGCSTREVLISYALRSNSRLK